MRIRICKRYEGLIDSNIAGEPHISYRFGYAFIVLAHLTDGSDPNSCPEGQFIQSQFDTIKFYANSQVPGGRLTLISAKAVPNHMYPREDILKFKTLEDLHLVDNKAIE